jgi:L-alanine-DL-glutamate epimerase-like enolase superfamily enzyme
VSTITSIEITHHQLPLDPPFPASWDPRPRTRFPATIVRVHDSDGRVGVGSGDVMYGFADYAQHFIGEDPLHLEQHAARLANIEFHAGRPWPLDVALWDLAGKCADAPVWSLLGGASSRLRLYASSAVHRPIAEMVAVAQHLLDVGFDALKVRFGRASIHDDLAVVKAIRDAVGERLTLMVDCNQGWRMPWDTTQPWTVDHATEVALELQHEGVFWMEEPLHRGDYAGMTELRHRVRAAAVTGHDPLRIAGGEMTREPYEFRELLERDCLDVFQPDCVITQGISGLAPLARRVAAAGKLFTPHTWGNGIGVLANLHLAAGTVGATGSGWVEYPYDPPEWSLERRDYPLRFPLRHHATADGAWIDIGDRPGLGIDLDETALDRTISTVATFQ